MFGYGKKAADIDAAATMLSLVREQWSDIEEAKNIAIMALLLGEKEFYPIAPEFKTKSVKQRSVAIAMYTSISKTGGSRLGKDGATKLFRAAADYAGKQGEATFFCDLRKSLGID
jgi:hypothetical protein